MSAERARIECDLMSILGYTAETQAPNGQPTTEFVTDRWMKPRRDALVEYVLDKMARAWERGRAAERRDWEFAYDLTTPDEVRQPWPNPYPSGPPVQAPPT